MTMLSERLRAGLRPIPDHPKPGILFQDITPVLLNGALFQDVVSALAGIAQAVRATHVAGMEARGFIFAAPVAAQLGLSFVPLRKPGKLPWERVQERFALEYGEDALEAHRDAFEEGARVLIVDDVLATGGTAAAAERLVAQLGATVAGLAFVVEIGALNGNARLSGRAQVLLSL